jgi:hypothetical protein
MQSILMLNDDLGAKSVMEDKLALLKSFVYIEKFFVVLPKCCCGDFFHRW